MQTTIYDNLKGLQQSLQNLKSQTNFADPDLSNKFSVLVESFMSFAEETAASSNSQEATINTAEETSSSVSASEHFQQRSVVSTDPVNTVTAERSVSSSLVLTDPFASEPFRPTPLEFSRKVEIQFEEAASLISGASSYGHDYRNWSEIMASSDPVGSLRKANSEVYNSNLDHTPYARSEQYIEQKDVIAANGNFAVVDGHNGYKRLMLVAKDGLMLTQAGTHEDQIRTNIDRFGFNSSELTPLIAKVEQFDEVLAEEMRRALG